MALLIPIVTFIAGLLIGGVLAAAWLRREGAGAVSLAEPAIGPRQEPAAAQQEPDGDADLKPVLDATRGVLSELEQRYQGARAETDRPKRRAPRSRA